MDLSDVVRGNIIKPKQQIETTSDKIDKVLTHKWFGLPIFALIMFSIYQLTFIIGEDILGGSVAFLLETLGENVAAWLEGINAPDMLVSFVTDGIFGGIGAVLEFVS